MSWNGMSMIRGLVGSPLGATEAGPRFGEFENECPRIGCADVRESGGTERLQPAQK